MAGIISGLVEEHSGTEMNRSIPTVEQTVSDGQIVSRALCPVAGGENVSQKP